MSSKNTSPLLSANRAPTLLERPVNKGSSCAPPKVFKALRLQVGEDLKTRNALRPDNSPYKFSLADNGGAFSALMEVNVVHRSVIFSLAEHAIVVRDEKGRCHV
jgi:hypothetical protein